MRLDVKTALGEDTQALETRLNAMDRGDLLDAMTVLLQAYTKTVDPDTQVGKIGLLDLRTKFWPKACGYENAPAHSTYLKRQADGWHTLTPVPNGM